MTKEVILFLILLEHLRAEIWVPGLQFLSLSFFFLCCEANVDLVYNIVRVFAHTSCFRFLRQILALEVQPAISDSEKIRKKKDHSEYDV